MPAVTPPARRTRQAGPPYVGLLAVVVAVVVAVVGACSATAEPSGFRVDYRTGSVPPPYNHEYVLEATVDSQAIDLHYTLTYRFRDSITEAQLVEQGYSANDDLDWTGRLEGDEAKAWVDLLRRTELRALPQPEAAGVGGDAFSVTLVDARGATRTGVPSDRPAWDALIAAVDRRAHADSGAARSER